MIKKPVVVSCPQCGKEVVWNSGSRYRPFCSERCKLIDLGQWANEEYRIEQREQETSEETSVPVSFRS